MLAGRAMAALALTALAVTGLLAAPAAAKPHRFPRGGPGSANPSALVAMEIAFARMAAEKGQWAAFRKFADDDAVMFVPQVVRAKDWLKGRKEPAKAVAWQPYQVWMSCDGTLGVTKGAWQRPDGSVGYFTTAWKKQKDGGYRWTMDQGDGLKEPLAQPDFLEAKVADCPVRRRGQAPVADGAPIVVTGNAAIDPSLASGTADDGTLTWTVKVEPSGARALTVKWAKEGGMGTALEVRVAAGG